MIEELLQPAVLPLCVADTSSTTNELVVELVIFVLATYVGVEIIKKVPTILHTPLMSGSNAISGITIVGSIVVAGNAVGLLSSTFGFLAVVLAMINVMGGYLVTDRMLQMFKKGAEGKTESSTSPPR